MTACSPGNTNTSSDATGASTPLGTPSVSADPAGELTIWDRSGDLFEVFDKAIATFTDKYPKVTVNHLAVDVNAKLPNTLIAGTDVPDGAFYDDVLVPGIAPHLFDLTDLIAPYTADIAPAKLGAATFDGRVIAVPWDLDPGLLFYREDVVEQASVDPAGIETYDDLLAAARTVQQANPDTKPIHLEANEWLSQLWIDMFASQQGGALVDENGDLALDSAPYRNALTWLNSVNDEGLGTLAKYFEPTDISTLEAGTQVFVPWAQWFVFGPQQLLPESAGQWRATTLPAWTADGPRSGIMGGSSFVVPAKAKNPELAWLLYEHLTFSEEGYTAVYGPNDVYPGGLNTSVPSYLPALDSAKPLFDPIEQLGGQDLWKVATDAAREMPGGYRVPVWWNKAVDYLGVNMQRMFNGQMTADEVIETSADQIQKNLIEGP
jgi:lactose/L-arabinose transport system substrate-binding protein